MPSLNEDRLAKPISRKVTATAGVAGVLAAGLTTAATTLHLDQYLPGGLLPLVIFVVTGLLSGAVGYVVRHGWVTEETVDSTIDYVTYGADPTQADQPPAAETTVGDATHINGTPLTVAAVGPATDASADTTVGDVPRKPSPTPRGGKK